MDKNEILKDLKKVDLNLIKKSDIKMFQAEKMAVEYYNDAVDNIVEGNTDIAVIKLKKVLSLSPDFSEAGQLLDRLSEYEKTHSIGDKVYESMHGRDVNSKMQFPGKKTLPQKLNIKPKNLLKLIIVITVITFTVIIALVLINLINRDKPKDNTDDNVVTYSQEEVNALNSRIEELEANLVISEGETQDALIASTGSAEAIALLEEERDTLKAQLELYKAAVLLEREEFVQSADIAKGLDGEAYKGDDKELYNEVYNIAIYQAADSLYKLGLSLNSQKDFAGAIEYLEKVDDYSPEFEELGNCYYNLGKAYLETDQADKALAIYKNIEMNLPGYENQVGLYYYTGKAYQKLNQFENAREMYNLLISEYPDSTWVGYAKDRLKEME